MIGALRACQSASVPGVVTFVDGVPCADVRLLADADETRAFGLFGTYLRQTALRPAWHDHAGLVRCEVTARLTLLRPSTSRIGVQHFSRISRREPAIRARLRC